MGQNLWLSRDFWPLWFIPIAYKSEATKCWTIYLKNKYFLRSLCASLLLRHVIIQGLKPVKSRGRFHDTLFNPDRDDYPTSLHQWHPWGLRHRPFKVHLYGRNHQNIFWFKREQFPGSIARYYKSGQQYKHGQHQPGGGWHILWGPQRQSHRGTQQGPENDQHIRAPNKKYQDHGGKGIQLQLSIPRQGLKRVRQKIKAGKASNWEFNWDHVCNQKSQFWKSTPGFILQESKQGNRPCAKVLSNPITINKRCRLIWVNLPRLFLSWPILAKMFI